MHELLTSEADINKERHAPHRYHTTMMASARSEVWREIPIFGARSQDLPPAFD